MAGSQVGTAFVEIQPDFSTFRKQTAAFFAGSGWRKAAAGAAAVGAAAAGATAALYEIGEAFDESYDKIRVNTGATGKELRKLKGDFRSVVGAVPTDFDTASTAVSELNRRLDVTGKPLRSLSKQFTELSRITGTDVGTNIQTVSRAFGDWEVRTRDQAAQLDKFFRASQKSGAAVSDLAAQVVQFGAPLRQVGFSLDEATAMFAAFEKAGVNTQTMMPGLRMALRSFLEAGRDPGRALQQTFEGIEDGTLKTTTALEIFGARAGPDMVEAIRQGRFELDELTRSMARGDETIRKAGRQTMDFSEHWLRFKNNVLLALEPLATDVFKAVGDGMRDVTKAFRRDGVDGVIDLITQAISDAIPKIIAKGKDLAAAVAEGFLDSGVWGALALGGIIAKMLGGVKALSAASVAGSTMAQRFATSAKAGLARAGIAAAAVGAFQIGSELEDVLSGESAAKKVGEKWGESLAVGIETGLDELKSRNQAGKIRAISDETDELIATWDEAGIEISEDVRKLPTVLDRAAGRIEVATANMRDRIHRLRVGYASDLDAVQENTRKNMEAIESLFGRHSKRGKELLEKNYRAAVAAIRKAMDDGRIATDKGARKIHSIMLDRLALYGIKGADAEKIILAQREGPRNFNHGLREGGLAAVVPGYDTGDSHTLAVDGVPVARVAGNEGIYVGNSRLMGALHRLNAMVPRRRTGGWVDPAGPGSGVVNPAIADVVGAWSRRYQAAINYGYDPGGGHQSPGHNVTGTATDTGPAAGWLPQPTRLFETGLRAIEGKVDQILYGTAGIGTPYDNHGRGDHAHIEWGSHPDAIAGTIARFKLPRFRGRFFQGKLGAAGLNRMSAGLERVMGARASRIGGGADAGAMGAPGMFSVSEMSSLWSATGGPRSQSRIAGAVGMAESGGNPRAVGPSTIYGRAKGLWQILGQVVAGNIFEPRVNALNAVKKYRDASGWSPWEAYTNGNYTQFLREGGAVGAVVGPTTSGRGIVPPPSRVRDRLRKLLRGISRTDERIAIAQALAGSPSSPSGSDLSLGEKSRQIKLHEILLSELMAVNRLGGRWRKFGSFREAMRMASGLTGRGGRILDTRVALDELRATTTGGVGSATGMSVAQFQAMADAIRLGVIPRFHQGGVYRAPFGQSEGLAVLKDQERVTPAGAAPTNIVVRVLDGAVDPNKIEVIVDGRIAERDRSLELRRRAGVA